jgi:hypothetical protein
MSYFHPDLREPIRRNIIATQGNIPPESAIYQVLTPRFHQNMNRFLTEDQLFACADAIFSPKLMACKRALSIQHDRFGIDKHLRDHIVHEITFGEWLSNQIGEICYQVQHTSIPQPTMDSDFSLDGPSSPRPPSTSQPALAPIHGPFRMEQIILPGPNLKQAWVNCCQAHPGHPFVYDMPSDWTPASSGSAYCFHGTSSQELRHIVKGPQLYHSRTGIVPYLIGTFHTSFSALRSFLWGTFGCDMLASGLSPAQISMLNTPFTYNGARFCGMILLQMHTDTPAPQGLSSLVLPTVKAIDAWSAVSNSLDNAPRQNFLMHPGYTMIHASLGQHITSWPDVIYAQETSASSISLGDFTGDRKDGLLQFPAWRSGHCSLEAWNAVSSRVQAYAITWTPDRPPTHPRSKANALIWKIKSRLLNLIPICRPRVFRRPAKS